MFFMSKSSQRIPVAGRPPPYAKTAAKTAVPTRTGRRSAHSEALWHFTCHVEVTSFDSAERNLHSSKELTKARARERPFRVCPFPLELVTIKPWPRSSEGSLSGLLIQVAFIVVSLRLLS